MKKVYIFACLFLIFTFSLVACKSNDAVQKGMYIADVNKKYKPIFSQGGIYAYEIGNTYAVIIAKNNKVDKYAVFTQKWELQYFEGLQPIVANDLDESVGTPLNDITRKYGPYHADIGSGLYMPAYLLEGGYIAILYVDTGVITHVSIVPIFNSENRN